ncbi:MAG: transglycosylase domain-containing protein, partial [Actinobacteria bacterium]|nr:transglycosylase domain-containing protein [Actinomycetota bacterium]
TLHASVDRTIIPFRDMPESLTEAVIAAEDQDFYQHPGIDPIGIVRAAWNDLIARKAVQGASTITQQLVKNVYAGHYVDDPVYGSRYVTPPRTFGQKVREALLAIKLEQSYSKDEILARYLNTIYFGHGAYGVQAAAQTYWGKDATDLTLLESATLAGVVAAPSRFDPALYPSDAYVRRNYVLDRMVQEGYVTSARAAQLKERPVKTTTLEEPADYPAPFFVDYAKRYLFQKYEEAAVLGGGLRVTTTLDMGWQRAAERAVRGRLDSPGDPQAALVAIDPSNGAVRALYGGSNFDRSQVNLALSGAKGFAGTGRSTGSAFKPFTLAAAMEDKVSLNSRWYGPGTITIPDPACYTNGAPWTLSNASDSESGVFTLAQATAYSVNTVFAQLASKVGPDAVVDVAHRMGITSPLEPVCSITLGTQSVNPLEMADAYATLAARGVHHRPSPVEEVVGADGEVDGHISTRGDQAISRNDADLVTYALRGVITGGTGRAANIGRPAAGKTGTAQEYVDAWFCGYVPQLATCVWIGYPKGEIPMYSVEGFSPVYGGTIPALIWRDFMLEATARMPVKDFPTPSFEGYTGGPPTPPPVPAPSKSPKPSPSPSPTPSPTPSATPSPSPSPSPTPSPSPSPSPSPEPSPTPTAAPDRVRDGPVGRGPPGQVS